MAVSVAGQERCTRQYAQNVRTNVKFPLSREKIVRYTARIVFRSERTKVGKNSTKEEQYADKNFTQPSEM